MTELKDLLSQAETGDLRKFSKLEASLVQTEVQQRPNSRAQNDINRHAQVTDLNVNELDFDFNLDATHYPLHNLNSLQQVLDAVQCHEHLKRSDNFSSETDIDCLHVDSLKAEWRTLDDKGMVDFLETFSTVDDTNITRKTPRGSRLAVFFVPLVPAEGTSYGARARITQENAELLIRKLQINPLFVLNLLGRPDYWAPKSHWETDVDGKLAACDLFCQHPRWNLHFQGSPVSVYSRHDVSRNLTTYIISHKPADTSINALRSILNIAIDTSSKSNMPAIFMDAPFEIHVILSTLSLESSKHHVKRFQRFMWTQINKVNDHLAGLETSDRSRLGDLTKQLQIVSQNADSHIANADVAIFTASAIRDAHSRLAPWLPSSRTFIQRRVEDSISYVISSMEKQKTWFLNYKQRKDSTMSLVYNLVTQQDAANNIQIARSMKEDSTSMTSIAVLTMVFLPGTFVATVVDAEIFGASVRDKLWLIWVTITILLTVAVMVSWWLYQRMQDSRKMLKPVVSNGDNDTSMSAVEDKRRGSFRRRSVFSSFSFGSRLSRQRTVVGEEIR